MLVTVIAQSTANTTNSVKAIYFLSLKSCSRNKLICFSHVKILFFLILRGKNLSGKWCPTCHLFPYGPDRVNSKNTNSYISCLCDYRTCFVKKSGISYKLFQGWARDLYLCSTISQKDFKKWLLQRLASVVIINSQF